MPRTPTALPAALCEEYSLCPCGCERVACAAGPRAAVSGVAGTLVGGPRLRGIACARAVLRPAAVKLPWYPPWKGGARDWGDARPKLVLALLLFAGRRAAW